MKFNIPINGNEKLERLVSNIKSSKRLEGLLTLSNVNAIDRIGLTDHGPVHSKIVANSALKMFRILMKNGIGSSLERDHKMTKEDSEVVVVLAAFLHDLGHIIHREHHEIFSISLASQMIKELVGDIYNDYELAIIEGETLHAIYSHEVEVRPLTVEAGIIKVADALDMEEGRARIPFNTGKVNIHSISAMSIKKVSIKEGKDKPIHIQVEISTSAGIFQLDSLLKKKIKNSKLEKLIKVEAKFVRKGKEGEIVKKYEL